MPSHDYSAVVGGSIKIKRVKGSRIDKSKKKPKKSKNENLVPIDDTDAKTAPKATATPDTDLISQNREYGLDDVSARNDGQERQNTHLDDEQRIGAGKTEAERRHEERRRKRVMAFPQPSFCVLISEHRSQI